MSAKYSFFNPPPLSGELSRFEAAQQNGYEQALREIREGRKRSHWIWYIFPQLQGLGSSGMCRKYGVYGVEEAKKYLKNERLNGRLVEISEEVKGQMEKGRDVEVLMGSRIDALKLCSCMTLFREAAGELVKEEEGGRERFEKEEKLFGGVLERTSEMGYSKCNRTVNMLLQEKYERMKKEKVEREQGEL